MNTRTLPAPRPAASTPAPRRSAEPEQDFDHLEPQVAVEYLTVPGFMRRVENRWHLDDITRFGDKVRRVAEAMELAYLTTVDRSLGSIRVFPVPLLQRIYTVLAPQHGWPQIVEQPAPALEDTRKFTAETLRAHERVEKHLRTVLDAAQDERVQASLGVVLAWLAGEIARLGAELEEATPPAASA